MRAARGFNIPLLIKRSLNSALDTCLLFVRDWKQWAWRLQPLCGMNIETRDVEEQYILRVKDPALAEQLRCAPGHHRRRRHPPLLLLAQGARPSVLLCNAPNPP